MQDLKAILFDTFGTVVDWRGSLIADLAAYGQGRGITADWPAFVDAWRAAYHPSMERVRKGELPWTKLDDLHRRTLEELVRRFGLAGLTEADLSQLNRLWHRLRGWPDASPGLHRLKRRFVIAPLSNGNLSLLLDMARYADLPWDTVFGSDVFRHYKPDPETYLGACTLLDLPPARVMMTAAHQRDLAAARAQGLRTCFIPRPTEYGPERHGETEATEAWDVIAADLEDLAHRLGA